MHVGVERIWANYRRGRKKRYQHSLEECIENKSDTAPVTTFAWLETLPRTFPSERPCALFCAHLSLAHLPTRVAKSETGEHLSARADLQRGRVSM